MTRFFIFHTQLSKMQGEHWIRMANFRPEFYFVDLFDVKSTVRSDSITSRRCLYNCSPTPVLVVSARFVQPLISSSSVSKKLLEFEIEMYFVFRVFTFIIVTISFKTCGLFELFVQIHTLLFTFSNF